MEWQDIESAPRDGAYFLAYWPHRSRSEAWHKGQYRTHWTEWGNGCWEADGLGKPVERPTHWMPLPEPPTAETAI